MKTKVRNGKRFVSYSTEKKSCVFTCVFTSLTSNVLDQIDDEQDDNGSECVICMNETRNTIILPCRHLCLCHMCSDGLRFQASNCPICRAPFRALLQLRAMKKSQGSARVPVGKCHTVSEQQDVLWLACVLNAFQSDPDICQDDVPEGYEAVTLLEALNGPQHQSSNSDGVHALPAAPPFDGNHSVCRVDSIYSLTPCYVICLLSFRRSSNKS